MDKTTDLIHTYDGSIDDLPAFLRPGWEGKSAAIKTDEQQPTLQDEFEINAQVRIIGIGGAGAKVIEMLDTGRLSALAKFIVLDTQDDRLAGFVDGADLVVIIASLDESDAGITQWAAKISKEVGALTLRFSGDLLWGLSDARNVFENQMEQFEFFDASVNYLYDESEGSEKMSSQLINSISFHAVANIVTAVNVRGLFCVDFYDIRSIFDHGRRAKFAHVLIAAGVDPATRLKQELELGQLRHELAVAKRVMVTMLASQAQYPSVESIHKMINVVRRHCPDDVQMLFSMNEVAEYATGTFSLGIYTVAP